MPNICSGPKALPKKVSTELSVTYKLSDEQRQYYDENGFLVIKNLIDYTDLYTYKQHFIRICNGLESTPAVTIVKEKSLINNVDKKEGYINKLQDIQHDDVFMTYSEHPVLLDIVEQFIGEDILVINSMFINKPPGISVHPPHQDLHYFPYRPPEKIIGTWTAVDEVTVENGCLWMVPGSHKANKLYPHNVPGDLKLFYFIGDESAAAPERRVDMEMSPGDTVFFHPLLVHGSRANTSKNFRKSISTHFANTNCELLDLWGTSQDNLMRDLQQEAERRGLEGADSAAIWRMKSKEVIRKSKL